MRQQVRDTLIEIETEIQALIVHGDFGEAITKAWNAYGEKIVASIRWRLSGHVDDLLADGEDVAQDVLSAFCSSLPKNYDPLQGTVYDYLFGITTNCIGNKIRAQNRILRNYNAVSWGFQHRDLIAYQVNNPEIMVLEKERIVLEKERLARAVEEELSATEREIWKLYYDYNLSAADIANLKGTTRGAIRTRLCRMHIKIWKKINRDEIAFPVLLESCRAQLPVNISTMHWTGINLGNYNSSKEHLRFALAHEQVCKGFSSQFYSGLLMSFIQREYEAIFKGK